MSKVAILLTVFNRKDKTLQCLHSLYKQLPIDGYIFDVYLTNDGCTDGTPEAVAEQFPAVNIINSKGDLFWNRGMYRAWAEAAKQNYDFYLWLNDDIILYNTAVETLLSESLTCDNLAIIVGAVCSQVDNKMTYGGHKAGEKLAPNGVLQKCDTFNGNCVLVPSAVFNKIGNLDWRFRHAIGDLDYGYRASSAGICIYTASTYLGTCEANSKLPAWARPEIAFTKRVKNLYSPLGYAEPIPFFYFELRNFGLITAIKHFATIHIRVIFPHLWKN
ncbi:MAG: glycosyltransferase family 2 protein [Rikenellaceae bacterium]